MTNGELKEIIENHKHWLNEKGVCKMSEKSIYLERNGRKEYTKEEIANVLASLPSCEVDETSVLPPRKREDMVFIYYLHVDDEGNVLSDFYGEADCFTSRVGIWEYGIDEENSDDYFDEYGHTDGDFIYENENLECEAFTNVVEDLTDQVNAYLEELDMA